MMMDVLIFAFVFVFVFPSSFWSSSSSSFWSLAIDDDEIGPSPLGDTVKAQWVRSLASEVLIWNS